MLQLASNGREGVTAASASKSAVFWLPNTSKNLVLEMWKKFDIS